MANDVESTHDKHMQRMLLVGNDVHYFAGAIFFIIGSIFSNVAQHLYALHTGVFFILGSVCYLNGAVSKLIVDDWKVRRKRKENLDPEITDTLNLVASAFFSSGGILFTLGAAMFILNTPRWIFAAEVIWNVGSTFFFIGSVIKLATDQIELSNMYENGDPGQEKKRKLWASVVGSDLYIVGTALFSVGSAVFLINSPTSNVIGNTLWILGSVCFIPGSIYKYLSEP
jgi:hypothetical protein